MRTFWCVVFTTFGKKKTDMYRLTGKVQHYAWGGTEYLPWLLGKTHAHHQPFAEYWMGVHSGAPSRIWLTENAHAGLPELIRSEPRRHLGPAVKERFGDLPFLFKVLDVKGMLSIQVHHTKEAARIGFEAENAAGVPVDAPNRNYKDANHKPEVMVALGEFWLLHGFLAEHLLKARLEQTPELEFLLPIFEARGYQGLYRYVMELPEEGVDKVLLPLAQRVFPKYQAGLLDKTDPGFWTGRVLEEKAPVFRGLDRGIFSIYFFNIVRLTEGQGIFQGAGVPHAYLEGQNIELMSNSDNVLRGGLTPKHVDVVELMKHVCFEATVPDVMNGIPDGHALSYPCPVPDFAITKVHLPEGASHTLSGEGPRVAIQLSGKVHWSGNARLDTAHGASVWMEPGETCVLTASEPAILFVASVP
jgi:mannose-6-phosphate isomerase